MFSKPVLLGVLASACLVAAAGGGYVAMRQNGADRAASTLGSAAPAAAEAAPAAVPVAETEAVAEDPGVAPPAQPEAVDQPKAAATRPEPARKSAPAREAAPKTPARTPRPSPVRSRSEPVQQPRATATPSPAPVARPEAPPTVPSAPVAAAADLGRLPEVPPAPEYVEVTVPAAAVIGLQLDRQISSETARVEDPVEARVTRDVIAGGHVAIPAGSRALGSVTAVERGGKMKEVARLGVRFHTVILADGTRVPLRTETIFREGDPPSTESARKIGGGAIGGAILGAILGGGKGAMIGGATGAGAGTAAVMAGGRNPAVLPAGSIVNARLSEPVAVEVAKEQ